MGTDFKLPNGSWSNQFKFLIAAVAIFLSGLIFFYFYDADQANRHNRIGMLIGLMLLSFTITYLLLILIVSLFGFSRFKKGMLNFLIGDNGSYSLSRLQAVMWALVIIAGQFQIVIALLLNRHGMAFKYYQPVFSESANWLLALSMTGYVAVKGITVNSMTSAATGLGRQKIVPRWGDIVTGPNGLDFSKCQMLIWTLLAVGVYMSKCYYFNSYMISQPPATLIKLMEHMYDEYNSHQSLSDLYPYVPYLPWSFVVLMGMSQGVYVGKKLVPTFKLDNLKANKQNDLQDLSANLSAKKAQLAAILQNSDKNSSSRIDQLSISYIEQSIRQTQDEINSTNGDINQINEFLNNK